MINIKLFLERKDIPVKIDVVRNTNAIPISFHIADYQIPEGTEARIYLHKPSGAEVYNSAAIEENVVIVQPTMQMYAEEGEAIGQLQIIKDTTVAASFAIVFCIHKNIISDSAIESKDEFGILDTLINQAREEIKNAQNATSAANTAAESATTAANAANTGAEAATSAAESATTAADAANAGAEAATSAATSANAAADRANEAAGNIEQANIKPPAYSVSGESITAGNSAEKPLIGLTVHGRADQVSTTGAQLIDFEHAPTRSCVLVDASTGTYRCNMDNTSYSFLDLPESVFGKILSGKGKTLRFQCDTSKPGTVISIVIYGTREDGLDYQDAAGTPGSNYVEMVVSDQFTSVTRAVLRFNQTQGATTTDTTTIYSGLMLYFKESAVLPFEPYTGNAPSPSVEYPQAIDIAGSGRSINVKVVGANLFDISKVQSISGASGSQTTNNNDGTLLVQSSQGDSSGGYEDGKNVLRDLCPELRAGDIAVLSAKSTGSDKRIYLRGSKSPWTFGISRTISETDLDSIVMFYASGTSTSATISEIMINAGSVALPYEPYKTPQSVSLSTPNGLAGLKVSSGGNYTDASGQQWICDEIVRNERGTGKRIQRIEKNIYTGADNEEWKLHYINNYGIANFYIDVPSLKGIGINDRFIRQTTIIANTETEGFLPEGNRIDIRISSDKASTVDELKMWLSNHNMTVLTVLPEPIETNLSAEEIAALSALHTYNPTTTISNDAGCDMTAAYVTQYYQGVGDAMFYRVADNLTTETAGTSVLDAHQGKVLDNKIGALADLETTAKSSAVAAINEIKSDVSLLSDNTTLTVSNPILYRAEAYPSGFTREDIYTATKPCTIFVFASVELGGSGSTSGRIQIKFTKDSDDDASGLGQFASGVPFPSFSISGVFHLDAGEKIVLTTWSTEAFEFNFINVKTCVILDH